jgi:Xaa-Pro dipeptidase
MKEQRIKRVVSNMEKHGLNQMLITAPSSIFYLTGKWIEPGERMLALYINSKGTMKLFINELFPVEDLGIDLVIFNDKEDPIAYLSQVVEGGKVGIDKTWPSHFLIRLMEKKKDLLFINGSPIVDEVRMIKDSEEIQLMREASIANDRTMADLVRLVSEGHSERKIGKLLGDIYEKYDTYSFSFSPLIAYGANAAEPHHDSDNTELKAGDSVILDIGGRTNGYCSDMTRTVFFKEANEEAKKVYNIVLEANLAGIKAVKAGAKCSDVDKAARAVIEEAGYGKYFTHRTGHNIGIDVHEFPDISSINDMELKSGMIFSVEPGIYLPGKLGVRIEDLVVVTDTGCEILNGYTKELQIIE